MHVKRFEGATVQEALRKVRESFGPDAVVLQGGADALAEDPQSRLGLSNRALWDAVEAVAGLAPRRLVLGGVAFGALGTRLVVALERRMSGPYRAAPPPRSGDRRTSAFPVLFSHAERH